MCFPCRESALLLLLSCCAAAAAPRAASESTNAPSTQPIVLRIAADPNNLPFTNDRQEGFENKIANLIAHDLHATIEYTWWAQRRGFFRDTLKYGDCNLV